MHIASWIDRTPDLTTRQLLNVLSHRLLKAGVESTDYLDVIDDGFVTQRRVNINPNLGAALLRTELLLMLSDPLHLYLESRYLSPKRDFYCYDR